MVALYLFQLSQTVYITVSVTVTPWLKAFSIITTATHVRNGLNSWEHLRTPIDFRDELFMHKNLQ